MTTHRHQAKTAAPRPADADAGASSLAPRRSLLRYFGGKWTLAPWILAHLPPHRIYVEPFGGAASVLLRKPRSRIEVYNDLDEEIVGIFRVVQNPVDCQTLMRRLRRTPYARREFERAFEASRDPIIRAQRAIVRSFLSFYHASLHDASKRSFSDTKHISGGSSNIAQWRTYPRTLASVCQRLQGVLIECRPALDVIGSQDRPDTLFFVDPPYVSATRTERHIYRHEMDDAAHRQLLARLRTVRGMVVLAGYPSALYDQLLPGWHRSTRPFRAVGSQKPRTEVLWSNPRATALLRSA